MKTRQIAAVVLFAFLPATVSLPAFAQEDASTVAARARFKEGVDAFDKGRYEEARLSFLQAYTLKKHPAVLLNLAQSSAKSGHQLDAAKYFQQFLKEATTATPQQKRDAEAGLVEARKQVARIDVVAPPGTEISLDDQGKVGTTPFEPLDVEPGVHTVKSPQQSVTVTAVIGQKAEAKLGGSAAVPPPIAAITPPATSPYSAEPAAGSGSKGSTAVTVGSDQATGEKYRLPAYIGFAVAGAGLVSTILFAAFKADAQSKSDKVAEQIGKGAEARNLPRQGACNNTSAAAADLAGACATLRDNNSKVDTNATIANVSLGVTLVSAAFAITWFFAAPRRKETTTRTGSVLPSSPVLTPYAGYQSGGLSLTGEF